MARVRQRRGKFCSEVHIVSRGSSLPSSCTYAAVEMVHSPVVKVIHRLCGSTAWSDINFFVIVNNDTYSKWIEVFPTNSATLSATITMLQSTFTHFSLPEIIISDNGLCFDSKDFKLFFFLKMV